MCSLYRSSQSYQLKASSLTPSLPETLLPIYRAILRVHRKYFTVMWRELTGLSGLRGGYSSSSYFPAPFLVERERIRKFEKLNLKNRTISFFEIFHSLSWGRGLIWTINKYRRVVWTSIYDGYIDISRSTIIFFEYPFPIQKWISGRLSYWRLIIHVNRIEQWEQWGRKL